MQFSVLCSFRNKWNDPFFDFSFSFVEQLKMDSYAILKQLKKNQK